MKHTKGPWNEKGIYTILRYADKHDMDISESENVMPFSTDDARLISCAPEMLEALKEIYMIVRIHSQATENNFAWAEMCLIQEVIEKATGMKIEEVLK